MAAAVDPQQIDVALWRDDDDPPLVWEFGDATTPDILQGSIFVLTMQWRDGELVRRSEDADDALVVDVTARTVTWNYRAADTAPIERGAFGRYELKRIIADRARTWVWGQLTIKSGLFRA